MRILFATAGIFTLMFLSPLRVGGNTQSESASCPGDQAILADVERKRKAISEKESELNARESELAARERAIQEQLKRVEEIRNEIISRKESLQKESDQRVAKLVETFETMSPKTAAATLSKVSDELAVATMNRIDTPKLAKIMANMDPDRSSKLSELLAAVTPRGPASEKGGSQ